MNYVHDFHAGNHSEVFKHASLCLLIERLQKKETPIFLLDTHAGAGLFDLHSVEAQRTREADDGIRKVYESRAGVLRRYLDAVASFNSDRLRYYPGSPSLIRSMLRDQDRLVACEADAQPSLRLRDLMSSDKRVSVHHRDGYLAINAFVPPKERRGAVFIDPPFEKEDEFATAAITISKGIDKWPTGTFMFWYPIKGRSTIGSFRRRLEVNAPVFCAEFLAYAKRPELLSGSGLLVFNPPWQFDSDVRAIARALVPLFEDTGSSFSMEWWIKDA